MIYDDVRTPKQCMRIMSKLENCCSELTSDEESGWHWYDEFVGIMLEIHEEIELMDENDYESCEDTVNNFLEEFYDLCDEANVFLALK